MDRFIENRTLNLQYFKMFDSINMDRFIVFTILLTKSNFYLDSINMDRFIVLQDMKKNI